VSEDLRGLLTVGTRLAHDGQWWQVTELNGADVLLSGSRYCPRCLAANGGRWMLFPGASPGPSPAPTARSCSPTPARTAGTGTGAPAPGSPASQAAATSPVDGGKHYITLDNGRSA
jgi:hypothetical protein